HTHGNLVSMDLVAALQDARRALQALDGRREAIYAQMREVDETAVVLQAEIDGFELAIKRHHLDLHGPDEPVSTSASQWRAMNRTDAIERLLLENGPLGPSAISGELKERGRQNDSANLVSAALAYLKEQGRVRRIGNGTWEIGPRSSLVRA